MKKLATSLVLAISLFGGQHAFADSAACRTVKLSDPGWTDITSTNSVASVLLESLGYEADVKTMSVPIGYEALKNKETDVFLGNWMPAQQKFRDDLEKSKSAEQIVTNLTGAKFTLAVPSYVAAQGVKSFGDLAANADKFENRIYGIEPGAPANQNIEKIIADARFGLNGWKLVESGEQAMLAQVERAVRTQKWVVFLAWAPHPMNTKFELTYLSGGDDYFGANFGGAEVNTLARTGWASECPNAARLFSNLVFDLSIENVLMGKILDDGEDGEAAAKEWVKANPGQLDIWLKDVETVDGAPGLEAVRASLGL
ncbi:choline ABC transporter substrate-binding protein [Phyllobacterium sp. 21LDTY02-6]|uniref:choline ABC transporter substrate-binding protein n=1 Tax=Phyllobacterium sp. 21LDTY02-6 TaxID=2944903 RepID=UPI002021E23F|nr:choline ABC transporter substrate-binding protein [Phyllobacterium sp. 21LDTY02-6]MCO4319137.1 choline ABC transporter substrate-binding protein [Phyllobacterium sp. 21LDTY02-6]